ncbi:MAG: histidinol-phosphate transaminase [candidate division WOR-3 bacterium]
MINLKKVIIKLPPYEVPQEALIKLNQNESPYDIPEECKKEILEQMERVSWNRYPPEDPTDLIKALADYTQHPPEGIVIGNGSNELILASMLATCNKGDSVTVVRPGFALYPYLAKILQLKLREVRLRKDFSFNIGRLLRNAHQSKVLYLATPNNPTGTTLELEQIANLASVRQCMIVVDEAYYEFHGQTAQRLTLKYPNLLILRTFSKAFGLAGIRLGYLLAHPDVAKQIVKAKLPFSVGTFPILVASCLLHRKNLIDETVRMIISERTFLFEGLKNIPGIKPIPSRANFILFVLQGLSADMVFRRLYEKGILVRKFSHPELKNMLRVTVGRHDENSTFLAELGKIIGGLNA